MRLFFFYIFTTGKKQNKKVSKQKDYNFHKEKHLSFIRLINDFITYY